MNLRVYILAALLAAAGGGIFAARMMQLQPKLLPEQTPPGWEVEARTVIERGPRSIRTTMTIPPTDLGVRAVQETIRSDGLAAGVFERPGHRQILWTGNPKDRRAIVLSYNVLLERGLRGIRAPKDRVQGIELEEVFSKGDAAKARRFLSAARRAHKNPLERAEYIKNCVLSGGCPDAAFLNSPRSSERTRAKMLTALLNGGGLRAVLARGFLADASKRGAKPRYWVRAYIEKQWINLFVAKRTPLTAEQMIFWNYVQLGKAGQRGTVAADVQYSLIPKQQRLFLDPISRDEYKSTAWRFVTLGTLPVGLQAVHQVMLLIPLGALAITVLRSIMGIPTFGTFMPVLIALSFRDTGLWWGLALLSVVIAFGLAMRALLSHFQLLLVPRLSTNLSTVIVLVLIISRMSHELEFTRGLTVTLFPIVIITMIIERMSISWEEVGLRKTLVLFLTTMAVSVLTYLLMTERTVQYWIFSFPETTLLLIACMLLCGRYTGYRLSEYFRFRTFLKPY